ncbi:AAA family ATPase [Acinetobacter calcoaceticus]|uniref:AAA family ATPase n=1 Tax=Acinetobacter calcoaceticus TaxID=471 RepID=UPI00192B7E15|nr:DUF3696 domain-containing protein [Acinetobacter calcoaceticus]
MITNIELKNFKCYSEQQFSLGNLTVFCGNNSVGKSTAIQALAIPFQSSFSSEVLINGKLIDLGNTDDIFSRYSKGDDLYIALKIDNKIKYKWGVQKFSELTPSNYLSLFNKRINTKNLEKYYFRDFGFQFLEAERYGPRSFLKNNFDHSIKYWLGSRGEYVFQVLTELDQVAGARLEVDDKRILNIKHGPSIRRNIMNWMSQISPGFQLQSYSIDSAGISHAEFQAYGSENTKPINMGFGLSYCLSIVTALLITKPGGLVVIENPEAHLHPRGQSYLGRLIARTALAGVQVIIETHSDHLLNGIRVVASLDEEYTEGEFKVYFVAGNSNKASTVSEINIGKNGNLSAWPEGFFDQQAADMKVLIKGSE